MDVTYRLSVPPAAGFETWHPTEGRSLLSEELAAFELNPTIDLPSGEFELSAGETKTAQYVSR